IKTSHLEKAGEVDKDLRGYVDKALRGYYDTSVEKAEKESGIAERDLRDWFAQQLITPQKTRGQVSQNEKSTLAIKPALKPLIASHVVRPERRLQTFWYELAHDRLVNPVIDSNEAWFQKHLSDLQKRAELWRDKDKNDGLLLKEPELQETWEREENPAPGTLE